jgi:hypothetical protein
MISAQTLCGCREGKPVSTFPDHALALLQSTHKVAAQNVQKHNSSKCARHVQQQTTGDTAYSWLEASWASQVQPILRTECG